MRQSRFWTGSRILCFMVRVLNFAPVQLIFAKSCIPRARMCDVVKILVDVRASFIGLQILICQSSPHWEVSRGRRPVWKDCPRTTTSLIFAFENLQTIVAFWGSPPPTICSQLAFFASATRLLCCQNMKVGQGMNCRSPQGCFIVGIQQDFYNKTFL